MGKEKVKTMNNVRNWLHPFVLVLLISIPPASFAQPSKDTTRKNRFEVYLPICHFFDETNTNWGFLVPYRSNYFFNEKGELIKYDEKYGILLTFGLQYSREIPPASQVRLSMLFYLRNYSPDGKEKMGQVTAREYFLFSVGHLIPITAGNKFLVYALGEVNYRFGFETVHIYYYGFEDVGEVFDLSDFGLSAGIRFESYLLRNFVAFGEVKYTRFVYLYSDGIDFFERHKDPTPNTLTLKFGVGYRF